MTDYFYTPPEFISDDTLEIVGEEFNHLIHVMRKKLGDRIRVVDGCGHAFDATIKEISRQVAVAFIAERYENHNEPTLDVTIAAGVLKNPSRFDFLVEKVTEIGVRGIIPITCERTIAHHARHERWQKLALAAMKQCGRSICPSVSEARAFADLMRGAGGRFDHMFVCHEGTEARKSLADSWNEVRKEAVDRGRVLIVVGPEGGFSDLEISLSLEAGSHIVSLGPRRLRTETAAIGATALVLHS